MKVVLYGIEGLYNYGCEAIVRGAEIIIKTACPSAEVLYYSKRAEEDRAKIADTEIQVVDAKQERRVVDRIINKILSKLGLSYRIADRIYKKIVRETDVFVSIGGDIYTIPQIRREHRKYQYYNPLIQLGKMIKKNDKKEIIFGASIGPFGNYKKANAYYFSHLKQVDLIVARELQCENYLKEHNVSDNVRFLPDPAFLVNSDCLVKGEPKYIGVNLSPLSFNEVYGCVKAELYDCIAKELEKIWNNTHIPIMLIPHVISPLSVMDNDFLFLQELYQHLSKEIKNNTCVAEPRSFLEAKQYLRDCKILVSARMHCAINAISEHVPTLFVSYSAKSEGMADFVYGENAKWKLPVDKIENNLEAKMMELLNEESKVRLYLEKRMGEITNDMMKGETLNRIREVLS